MKELSLMQLDEIEGGSDIGCAVAWVSVGFAAAGAIASGGALLPFLGVMVTFVGMGESCS